MADDRAREIRRLLLSGDNILKHRDGPQAVARARERFLSAATLADDLGDESLTAIIAARLAALLPEGDG